MTYKTSTSPLGLLSVTAAAALALSACAPEETAEQETNDDAAQTSPAAESPAEDEATDTPAAEPTGDAETADESPEATATSEATEDETAAASGDHPVYQAIDAVMEEYPDGVVTHFEDEDNYVEVYVWDGSTEWELEVDSTDFQITSTEEDDDFDDDDRMKVDAVEIDIIEAIRTAESEGGADPYQGDLDDEDSTVVWEIELANGTEVYVDVTTGDVMRTED